MPIVFITVFLMLGIALGYYTHPSGIVTYSLFTVAFAVFTVVYYKSNKHLLQKPYFTIAVCLLSVCTGMLLQQLHYGSNQKSHYSHFINSGNTPVIKGFITERLKPNDYAQKYYFEVTGIDKQKTTGKLLINVPIDSLNRLFSPGDKLVMTAELKPVNKPLNPYQFDYAAYMEKQDVFHQAYLKNNFISAGQVHNPDYFTGRLRNTLTGSFTQHNFSPEVTNMVNALLFGQRQDMDKQTNTSYTNAGVVHILAISGLHITLLFAILTFILRPLQSLRRGKLISLTAILAFLWVFALVSGLSASVVRSVVMFSFISIGLYFNRSAGIYNSVAVSALVLLLFKPAFLFDAGFQLSYAAVLAIVAFQPLYINIRLSKYKAVNYCIDTVAISVIAQIGVLPLTLYYFNQFPLLFLPANLVAIPLSTVILVLGLLILALNFIWPGAALPAGKLLSLLIEAMNGFIQWIASYETLVIKNISFTLLLNILLYSVIILFTLWLYKKSYKSTVALLLSVIVFQAAYAGTKWMAHSNTELLVFNNRKSSLTGLKQGRELTILANDSLALNNTAVTVYGKGSFTNSIVHKPLPGILYFIDTKVLVIDSLCAYTITQKPDVVILTRSAKINLERALQQLQPKQVVADGTNSKTCISRWAATCRKQKIPFHATAEKGFYKMQ